MSNPWTFANLDLSDVDAQRAGGGLQPGKHVMVINAAELKPSKSGIQIILYLEEIEGAGSTKDYITIHSNSAEENMKLAERIGKERFKSVLECAEHPNPNNPGDIHSLDGLVVGVICERSEDWTDQYGNVKPGGVKPRRAGGAYVPAKTLGYTGSLKVPPIRKSWAGTGAGRVAAPAKTPATAGADLDDDIPF